MLITRYTEVQVEVSIEDVVAELRDSVATEDTVRTVLTGVNTCWQFLQSIPDETIAAMTPRNRQVIADALRAQAGRYCIEEEVEG